MLVITDRKQLKKVCKSVSIEESHEIGKALLKEMFLRGNAIGLAAPQLGFDARVFAVKFSGKKPFDSECYFIDPEIKEMQDPILSTEGCLSIPEKFVSKIRWNKIFVVDKINPEGYWIEGLPAIIFAHERDHLDGILMDDEPLNVYVQCPCGSGKKFKFCHMKKNA